MFIRSNRLCLPGSGNIQTLCVGYASLRQREREREGAASLHFFFDDLFALGSMGREGGREGEREQEDNSRHVATSSHCLSACLLIFIRIEFKFRLSKA